MTSSQATPSSNDQSRRFTPARSTKQRRAVERQNRITEAAIAVIAQQGIAGVTHRLVAREAGVSLAATTYHYQAKLDIIADASARLLQAYSDAFRRFLERNGERSTRSFRDFAMRVVVNAAGRHRTATLAWSEIILDGARHSDTRAIANQWFERLFGIWLEIAVAFNVEDAHSAVRSAIDTVVGLLFVVIPLGLSEEQVEAVLFGDRGPATWWGPCAADDGIRSVPLRSGRKAEETRERILAAAIDILTAEGAGGVNYRSVAKHAGLSAPAPIYHFPSVDSLLVAAQIRLFDTAKDRYRQIMTSVDFAKLDIERLADLTAAVFLREATEFGAVSVASYPIWLEAARHPQVRATIWSAVDDQNQAWDRLLQQLAPRTNALAPLLLQCLFMGKLIRLLATGPHIADLADVRSGFAHMLRGIVGENLWL